MPSLKILFSLEQEAKYREIIHEILARPENKRYEKEAGVLTNMAIHEMVKQANESSSDFFDLYPDWMECCLEWNFLSIHIDEWLYNEKYKSIRLKIEEREEKITGKVSNHIEEPSYPDRFRRSKVLNRDGLDPDRELTQEEIAQFFEEDMEYRAERYGLDVDEFKELVGNKVRRNQKNRRKKPQGFGKK